MLFLDERILIIQNIILHIESIYDKIRLIVLFVGGNTMSNYRLTAFEKSGESIIDEQFEANNDTEAKEIGEQKLAIAGALDKTHRCINPTGKLLLFHP